MTVIIKLGTRLLTKSDGKLDRDNIFRIVSEIGILLDRKKKVIIVSSGAIGAGCGRIKCNPQNLSINQKQAIASVGQTELMNIYKEAFQRQKRLVGQILVTSKDFSDRRSYLNIRNTLFTLLKMGVIPIINENDSVAVEELKFGDNDHLAAIIASKVDADKLIILTDVDGLLDRNGKIVKEVDRITENIKKLAYGSKSDYSVGGMKSKIKAAEIVTKICSSQIYIANGRKKGALTSIMNGENPGTHFKGTECNLSHKKRWIAYGLKPAGNLVLDNGALKALTDMNSSLLAVGIRSFDGTFKEGDAVNCKNMRGKIVARGLINYSSKELSIIAGKKSPDIKKILGYKVYDEVIHKDNLVIL